MTPILEIQNLSHVYSADTPFERAALRDVSLSIQRGEFVGLIGHTGSGKSTLIQHFNGLLKPTSGRVLFDGEDIWKDVKFTREIRFKVGLVFQYPEHQLFEETVYQDISFGPKNMGLSEEEIRARVACNLILAVGRYRLGYANKLFHVLIVLLEQGKDGFVVLAVSQKLVFNFLGSNVIITPLHFVVDGVQRCVYIA